MPAARHGMTSLRVRRRRARVKCLRGVPKGSLGGDRRSECRAARFLAEFPSVAWFQRDRWREVCVAESRGQQVSERMGGRDTGAGVRSGPPSTCVNSGGKSGPFCGPPTARRTVASFGTKSVASAGPRVASPGNVGVASTVGRKWAAIVPGCAHAQEAEEIATARLHGFLLCRMSAILGGC